MVPWLFSCPVIKSSFQFYCYKRGSHLQIMCFCKRLDCCASITEWLQLPLWICAVWVMPTLRGDPCRRVHPARTLKGEFDVCHADPGCHVFIYLWEQVTFTRFCSAVLYWATSGWSSKLFLFSPWHSCCWDSDEGSSVQVCVKRPFHKQCPLQTSLPASGPRQSLTVGRVTHVNPFK